MTTPTPEALAKAEVLWERIVRAGIAGDEMAVQWIAGVLTEQAREIERLRAILAQVVAKNARVQAPEAFRDPADWIVITREAFDAARAAAQGGDHA